MPGRGLLDEKRTESNFDRFTTRSRNSNLTCLKNLPSTPIPKHQEGLRMRGEEHTLSYSRVSNSLPSSPSNKLTNVLNTSKAFVSNSFRPCITSSFISAPSIRMPMIFSSLCLKVLTWECALKDAMRRISIAGKRFVEGQERISSARTGRRG